jgi:hypothetical protein
VDKVKPCVWQEPLEPGHGSWGIDRIGKGQHDGGGCLKEQASSKMMRQIVPINVGAEGESKKAVSNMPTFYCTVPSCHPEFPPKGA